MKKFSTLYRRFNRVFNSLKDRCFKIHLKLLGQIDFAASASIHHKAIVQLDNRNKRDTVLTIGANSNIKRNALIAPRCGFITIGENCSVNPNCILLGYGGITIGNNVRIAANTSIIAFNHNFRDSSIPIIEQGNNFKGITIENDVWIGTGVRVLDGVTIGSGSVIGAGSVVTKNIPDNTISVGVPSKVISQRQA